MSLTANNKPSALERHRQQFPALTNKAYFNYGGQGPLPEDSLTAMYQAHKDIQRHGPFSNAALEWFKAESRLLRLTMAKALRVPPNTLTLTENVTVGCNIPLWGLAWRAGDHILISDCEHPGIIAAVKEICRRFDVVLSVCSLMDAANPLEAIAASLRRDTRLLVISHLLWNTGQIVPLQSIVRLCHQQSTLVLVDAAQSVGSLPLDLTQLEADFYAFTGHKWWCGPAGLGGLYVRPEATEQINPTFIGWRGITINADAQPTGWKASGERFEVATSDYPLFCSLRQALTLHNSWGSDRDRYDRLVSLSQRLWQGLNKLPQVNCLLPTPPEAGLVSFWVLDANRSPAKADYHRQMVETLETRGFFLRTLAYPHCARACTHYFTLESEVDQLVEAIAAYIDEFSPDH